MLEYALRLFGEDSAPAQWYLSRGITPISQSIEQDHGQCAYYPAAALLPLQEEAPDRVMVLWHAYTWVWFMLGVAAVYGFCREAKLSRPVSCGGMLLLYLCPRFFAEGHYNSKDMVLLTLFCARCGWGCASSSSRAFCVARCFLWRAPWPPTPRLWVFLCGD